MTNILIPLGGRSVFFADSQYKFPKSLIEINGKSMIELVVENINTITEDKRFIFVINNEEKLKYHMDNMLKLITNDNCEVIVLMGETQGACCSALMAIDKINNDEELIICNGDQLINEDLNGILAAFRQNEYESAVVCFEALHPRWAFARIEDGLVIEAAEKRPISKHAIAGFYYYHKGSDFVASAMRMIEKDANVNGLYYLAPVLNEMILANKPVGTYMMDTSRYFTFNVPEKVKEYIESTRAESLRGGVR